jgi:hypothetical protein
LEALGMSDVKVAKGKARSPQYPVIGLGEAIAKVQAVFVKDYQNRIPKAVVAKHMGFNALHGKSLGVLAALTRYGLLEGRGDDCRVSDRALAIIAHQPGSHERIDAVQAAANAPTIFQELDAKFPDGRGSDEGMRAYLLTNKFIPDAADTAIRSYRETKNVVTAEMQGYDSATGVGAREVEAASAGSGKPTPPHNPPPPRRDPPPQRMGLALMEGERVVFTEESDTQRYIKLVASGEVDETLLEALSDYVKRQRKRLGLPDEPKSS